MKVASVIIHQHMMVSNLFVTVHLNANSPLSYAMLLENCDIQLPVLLEFITGLPTRRLVRPVPFDMNLNLLSSFY